MILLQEREEGLAGQVRGILDWTARGIPAASTRHAPF